MQGCIGIKGLVGIDAFFSILARYIGFRVQGLELRVHGLGFRGPVLSEACAEAV